MVFGGKADVKGFLAKMSHGLKNSHKSLGEDPEELKVESMARSFISNKDLEDWHPGKGTANMEVLGASKDGAFDIGFQWDEADSTSESEVNHFPALYRGQGQA